MIGKWAGHLGAWMVILIWGSTFVSSKVLLNNGLMPADIFFFRFLMAYTCLLILYHTKLFCDSWRDELVFLGMGITGGSIYFLAENMALLYSTSSNVSIIVCSCPLVTALLVGFFYPSERLSARQFIGVGIAFVGMVLIVLNGQLILHLNPLGDTFAMSAAILWAIYSLLFKLVEKKYRNSFIARKVFFYGLLTILPYFLFISPLKFDTALFSRHVVLANLLFLGLLASCGAYLLWTQVMKRLGAVKASTYIYLQSLVTMLVAAICLNERITWMAILGTFILISGMVLAEKGTSRNEAHTDLRPD